MQMNKMWVAVGMAAFVATAGLAAELKIATVDLDRVFTAHPKTQSAQADLDAARDAILAEQEQIEADAKALKDEELRLREASRSPLLTDEARLQRRAEAEDKETEFQEFMLRARRNQESKLKQLRERELATRQGIVDELMQELADFAESEGYALILDRSGMTMNMIPVAVYSSPDLDVTGQLIRRLNKAAP